MSQYIPLNDFLQKYTNSPVEFKMYIGNKIQTDSEYRIHEVAGESKIDHYNNKYDKHWSELEEKVAENALSATIDILNYRFEYNIKLNQIAEVADDMIHKIKTIIDIMDPELLVMVHILDVWGDYDLDAVFCIAAIE